MPTLPDLKYNDQGLIPVIVIDVDDGTVLMQAWMNAESLQKTVNSKDLWYWSRSRQELWRKGATSGHTQKLISLHTDCDTDSLLAVVEQTGPACHLGTRSCFTVPIV